jgi:hypothetical protein
VTHHGNDVTATQKVLSFELTGGRQWADVPGLEARHEGLGGLLAVDAGNRTAETLVRQDLVGDSPHPVDPGIGARGTA